MNGEVGLSGKEGTLPEMQACWLYLLSAPNTNNMMVIISIGGDEIGTRTFRKSDLGERAGTMTLTLIEWNHLSFHMII